MVTAFDHGAKLPIMPSPTMITVALKLPLVGFMADFSSSNRLKCKEKEVEGKGKGSALGHGR